MVFLDVGFVSVSLLSWLPSLMALRPIGHVLQWAREQLRGRLLVFQSEPPVSVRSMQDPRMPYFAVTALERGVRGRGSQVSSVLLSSVALV